MGPEGDCHLESLQSPTLLKQLNALFRHAHVCMAPPLQQGRAVPDRRPGQPQRDVPAAQTAEVPSRHRLPAAPGADEAAESQKSRRRLGESERQRSWGRGGLRCRADAAPRRFLHPACTSGTTGRHCPLSGGHHRHPFFYVARSMGWWVPPFSCCGCCHVHWVRGTYVSHVISPWLTNRTGNL